MAFGSTLCLFNFDLFYFFGVLEEELELLLSDSEEDFLFLYFFRFCFYFLLTLASSELVENGDELELDFYRLITIFLEFLFYFFFNSSVLLTSAFIELIELL